MPFIAYKITHRDSGKAYIGITTRTLEQRWAAHIAQAPHKPSAMGRAILKYGRGAFDIEHIASSFDKSNLMALERVLIAQHETKSPLGYNLTAGGEGAFDPPPEVRAKLALALTGRIFTAEHRAKIGRASANRDPEMWVRVSQKLTGRKTGRSPGSKSIEAFKDLNKRRTGIPLSAEHRAAISRGQTGLKRPPGTGAKIAATKIGKPRTEAAKAAMRDGWAAKKAAMHRPQMELF